MKGEVFGLAFLFFFGMLSLSHAIGRAEKLRANIFSGYDKSLRPDCQHHSVVNLTLSSKIRQIVGIDAASQSLRVKLWLQIKWADCRLKWNATDYGVDNIVVPSSRIWIPDLAISESETGELFTETGDYRLRIGPNGQMDFFWGITLNTFCKLKSTYFPFDKQVCTFTFSSALYDSSEVMLWAASSQPDLSLMKTSSAWKVLGYSASKEFEYYNPHPVPFVLITYTLSIQRKPLFHVITLVIPCLLITSLTILGFVMPLDAGGKVSLQTTIMITLTFFLTVLQESLPPSSDTFPILGYYFLFSVVLVGISCSLTVVVVNIHFHNNTRVPRWMRVYITDKIGKLLCFSFTNDIPPNVPPTLVKHCGRSKGDNLQVWLKRFQINKRDVIREHIDSPSTTKKTNSIFLSKNIVKNEQITQVIEPTEQVRCSIEIDSDSSLDNISTTNHQLGAYKSAASNERSDATKHVAGDKSDMSDFNKRADNSCGDSDKRCLSGKRMAIYSIQQNYVDREIEDIRIKEWHQLAAVIDRLLLLFSCSVLLIVTLVLSIECVTAAL